MSYGDWNGDHEAVRMFARTVASAIYYARMVKEQTPEDQRKAWYDEITVLRSAPSAKAFLERALILIEQGHREYSLVGTARRGEAFAPASLLNSIGSDRVAFETFRDLFRMYLVQESTPRGRSDATDAALTDETGEEEAE